MRVELLGRGRQIAIKLPGRIELCVHSGNCSGIVIAPITSAMGKVTQTTEFKQNS